MLLPWALICEPRLLILTPSSCIGCQAALTLASNAGSCSRYALPWSRNHRNWPLTVSFKCLICTPSISLPVVVTLSLLLSTSAYPSSAPLNTLICLLGGAGATGGWGGSGGCTASTLPLIRMPARLRIKRWGVLMAASLKSDRAWTVALDGMHLQQCAMEGQNGWLDGMFMRWMANRPGKKKRRWEPSAESAVVRHGQDNASKHAHRAPRDEASKQRTELHAGATDSKQIKKRRPEVSAKTPWYGVA